jgi:hypothetical protein
MIIDGIIIYPIPQQQELIECFSNAASQLVLEKATQISSLENALAHCKNERDDAISQIQAVKDHLEMILSEKKALLSSNSWRLTKPLRFIKDWFLTNS